MNKIESGAALVFGLAARVPLYVRSTVDLWSQYRLCVILSLRTRLSGAQSRCFEIQLGSDRISIKTM